jgi:hypothetical protein
VACTHLAMAGRPVELNRDSQGGSGGNLLITWVCYYGAKGANHGGVRNALPSLTLGVQQAGRCPTFMSRTWLQDLINVDQYGRQDCAAVQRH